MKISMDGGLSEWVVEQAAYRAFRSHYCQLYQLQHIDVYTQWQAYKDKDYWLAIARAVLEGI